MFDFKYLINKIVLFCIFIILPTTTSCINVENQDTEINKSERYFPVTIKAENGNLIDGNVEIGQFDFFLNINQYSQNSSLEKYKIRLKSYQNFGHLLPS